MIRRRTQETGTGDYVRDYVRPAFKEFLWSEFSTLAAGLITLALLLLGVWIFLG